MPRLLQPAPARPDHAPLHLLRSSGHALPPFVFHGSHKKYTKFPPPFVPPFVPQEQIPSTLCLPSPDGVVPSASMVLSHRPRWCFPIGRETGTCPEHSRGGHSFLFRYAQRIPFTTSVLRLPFSNLFVPGSFYFKKRIRIHPPSTRCDDQPTSPSNLRTVRPVRPVRRVRPPSLPNPIRFFGSP
jgi:hypothetical protein